MGYRYDAYSVHRTVAFFFSSAAEDKEFKREVAAFDIHRGVGANLAFVCGASDLDPGRFDTDPASMLPHYGSGYFFSVAFWMATKITKFLRGFGFLLITHSL